MYTRNQSQSYSRHDRRGVTFQSLGYHPAPQRRKSWVVATAILAIVAWVRTLAPNGILRKPAQMLKPDTIATSPHGRLHIPTSGSGPMLALLANSADTDSSSRNSRSAKENFLQQFAPPCPVLIAEKILDDRRIRAKMKALVLVVWVCNRQAIDPIDTLVA